MLKPILRWIGNQSWLRLGIRRRIVSSFYPSDRSPSFAFDVAYYGARYLGNISEWQEWHVYFFGGYELKEVSMIRHLLNHLNSPVVMDVGANLGGHALAMAEYALEIHAFEPFLPLADKAKLLFDRSPYKNITLHRFGLADANTEMDYYLDLNSPNSGTGSFDASHTGAPKVARLRLVNGDDWVGGKNIDFIKIDIEGFEAYALNGLKRTLETSRPFIIMEITETSLKNIERVGGLNALLPYECEMYEVCNPEYIFGFIQVRPYRLSLIEEIVARKVSFNIFLVPASKRTQIESIFV